LTSELSRKLPERTATSLVRRVRDACIKTIFWHYPDIQVIDYVLE